MGHELRVLAAEFPECWRVHVQEHGSLPSWGVANYCRWCLGAEEVKR